VGSTYVITEACIGVKDASCVEVCPAACIHTTPEAPQYYIDPEVCIACEQCVLVCPVNAIYLDEELPDHLNAYLKINERFFQENKPAAEPLSPERAQEIIAATTRYAEETGFAVAVAVVDGAGELIDSNLMSGAGEDLAPLALNKAYTAANLQIATHQLGRGPATPRFDEPRGFQRDRLVEVGGGYPVVDGDTVVGAVGVAGSPNPQADLLCCQAGLAAIRILH
jgi:ferredoxin